MNVRQSAESDAIVVTYTETEYDREFVADGTVYVEGLPYRAGFDGVKAAATTPEGARAMVRRMLDRRITPSEESDRVSD